MTRKPTSMLALMLTLLAGAAQPAIAREGLSQKAFVATAAESATITAANAKPGSEFKDCDQCPPMIVVPAGKFVMGSPATEAGHIATEAPQHHVTIDRPFAVGKYEITFADWEACVTDRRCARLEDSGFGRGRRPVINVSYDDAKRYVAWLSEKTNWKYRLLTETEWEYAARAGSDKARYWGDSLDEACQFANVFNPTTKGKYKDAERKSFPCNDGQVETAPVGSFKPNRFGLHDMLGNVWEWVEDCWNDSYAGAPSNASAWTTGNCSRRVVRGGGWYYGPRNVRSAKRLPTAPVQRSHDLGFRVARGLP